MKTVYFKEETIVAFHIGRGGRFWQPGHLSFIGEKNIGDFIDDLFWEVDENGVALPDAELKDENGNEVGCTWADVEKGIGRIDIDGKYDTVYTMMLKDVEQDSAEWKAIFEAAGFDAEQAQMFLRPELAIDELSEFADYINEHKDWEEVVDDVCEKNNWYDERSVENCVCSNYYEERIIIDDNGKAIVIEALL